MKRMVCCAAIALCMSALPGSAASLDAIFGAQASPETVGTPRDPGARAEEMRALQQHLAAGRVAQAQKAPVMVELTNAERHRINETGNVEQKYFVGVAKPVGVAVDFTRANVGATRATNDGGFVWTASVKVAGATALRLHLTGVDLPAGAEMYVYNLAGQAFGPYTGRGPLGNGEVHTNTVFGQELLVQVHSPADADSAPRMTIAEVGVMGERFVAPRYGEKGFFDDGMKGLIGQASNLCATNANCVVNAACQSSPVVATAKDAIAGLLFQSGASFYICTGGLIADTVTATVIPYLLTAHHCISSSGEAASLETYFDYETTCSNPNCTQPYNNAGDTVGSTIKASGSTSDYTLVQLASTPVSTDGITTYLGWLSTPVANTNNLGLYRISHPKGSPQAYSEGVVDTSKGTCRTLNRGNFIYSRDTVGATEGGSSGSPVVNSAGQIVGQLYGACGTDVNNVCNAAANATVDGAFAVSYPNLAAFLNPGGGGGCGATGSSCTTNSQCCSNSCKGPAGGKTCK
ncbi:MAG: serine protease [Acidobacteriota bacterium]